MIWGSLGGPGQDWLDWQIWPSGQEPGSQPQAPGSIPPSPLMGSLWDLCGILVGSLWDLCGILVGSVWDPCGILVGSLWDPTSVLVGGAPSGGYFSSKNPF